MSPFTEVKETSGNITETGRRIASFERNPEDIKIIRLSCLNSHMEGRMHDDTNVLYKRRAFIHDGVIKEGVFPQFRSKFNLRLPESIWKASDTEQFKACTKVLSYAIDRRPELAKQFSSRQLQQIRAGEPRISGLTWHHSEIPGKMQLVNAYEHQLCSHKGGRSIWGGGQDCR